MFVLFTKLEPSSCVCTDEERPANCTSFDPFHLAVVTSSLQDMKQNSVDTQQRFPHLLQISWIPSYARWVVRLLTCIVCKAGHIKSVQNASYDRQLIFWSHVQEIPCWMFLSWISQMTVRQARAPSCARCTARHC